MRFYDCSTIHPHPPLVSLGRRYLPYKEEIGSSLGFLGNPWEACPELGTPATPARPRMAVVPDTAFRKANGVGIATRSDFGAESSRPAFLLCTLRTHNAIARLAVDAQAIDALITSRRLCTKPSTVAVTCQEVCHRNTQHSARLQLVQRENADCCRGDQRLEDSSFVIRYSS